MRLQTQYNEMLDTYFHKHVVIPELAMEISLEASIVIQQIHYWLQRCGKRIEGQLWIYNTFEQWKKHFRYWSISKIKKIFYSLEEQGFLSSKKMNVKKSDHTKWYTLNYPAVLELMKDLAKNSKLGEIDKEALELFIEIPSSELTEEEKNFPLSQSELSLYQSDTIINSNTKNNLHKNNYLTKEKEIFEIKKVKKLINNDVDSLTEGEKELCNDMLKVWASVFIKEKAITLTDRRKKKLLSIWKGLMKEDRGQWEEFCKKINSSKFLMGEKKEGFKASFDWLLEEEVATRVLTNEFGVGDRLLDIERRNDPKEKEKALSELTAALKEKDIEQIDSDMCDTEEKKREVEEEFLKYMSGDEKKNSMLDCYKYDSRWKYDKKFYHTLLNEFKLQYFLNKQYADYAEEAKMRLYATNQTGTRQ